MNKFALICVIFWTINSTEAQVARCEYKYQYFWTGGYKATNASYYRCDLDTTNANYNQKLTIIYGQHLTGHSDAGVKHIANFQDQKLKIFSSIFCQKFPNLEVIQIGDAEVELIDKDSLLNCQNLNSLILFGNKIHKLPEYFLIRNSKLTLFWISNNQLTTLPENLFLSQKKLEQLQLHENQINFLPSNIFRPLVKLETLYLFNNKLQSINLEWFVTLQNLKQLSLDENQIAEVPSKSFRSLRNLETLWLNDNRINTLNFDNFDGLQNLQILSLHHNEIFHLPVGVFTQLRNLKKLFLHNNKLTTIHSDSFGIHNQLEQIWLQDNKINEMDPKLILNSAVSNLNMEYNICSNFFIQIRSEIKPKLQKCFKNYRPRRSQLQNQIGQRFSPFYNQFPASGLNICGKPSAGQGNIVGGSQISRGSFPWLAVLVRPTGQYFGGGTLVSNRKVLTAAHCIQEKHSSKATTASEFLVLLGAYDLKKTFEADRVPYAVQSINVHPDWNSLTQAFDADIAVLVLEREVIFSDYIQPICMPNSNIVALKTGIVVGFGKSEDTTKIHENIAKLLKTPIHSNEDCFFRDYRLVKLSSRRTFCGGTGTGIGVCRGDSGSGLIVHDGSAYYLRGIVSSSLIGGPYGCDLNAYSVFTDVTKYIDWINGISTSRF